MQEVINIEAKVGTGSWLECFTGQPSGIPKLVYRTFLGIGIHFLQQWTGVSHRISAQIPELIIDKLVLALLLRSITCRFPQSRLAYEPAILQSSNLLVRMCIYTASIMGEPLASLDDGRENSDHRDYGQSATIFQSAGESRCF